MGIAFNPGSGPPPESNDSLPSLTEGVEGISPKGWRVRFCWSTRLQPRHRSLVGGTCHVGWSFPAFCRDHERCSPVGAIHELPLQRRRDLFRRDVLVTSDEYRLVTHPASPGTTSVPLRSIGGTCLSRPPPGGTRLSGPLISVGKSIAFRRGLKSHAESGAEAPHSIRCGDLSPLFGEGFSLHQPWRWSRWKRSTGWGGTRSCNPCNGKTLSVAPGTTSAPPTVHRTP